METTTQLKFDISIETNCFKQLSVNNFTGWFQVVDDTKGYNTKMKFDRRIEATMYYKSIKL